MKKNKLLKTFLLLTAMLVGSATNVSWGQATVLEYDNGTKTNCTLTFITDASNASNVTEESGKIKLGKGDSNGTTYCAQLVLVDGVFQDGDDISISYYVSNTSKDATPGLFFGNFTNETFTSVSNIQAEKTSAGSSAPATASLTVPAAANGTNALRLTRYSGGTTLYITHISITRASVATDAFTVSFDAGDHGTYTGGDIAETEPGAGITLPSLTTLADNYSFNGWYTAATEGTKAGDAGDTYNPTSNITLYAQYSEISAPTISVEPSATEVSRGTAVTLTATVTGTPTPTIQWYSNTSANNEGGTAIEGATSETYSPATTTIGTFYYYAVATNTQGSATSEVQTITVKGSDACELISVKFSNGAYGSIATLSEGAATVTVPYLAGESEPTVDESSIEISEGATKVVSGNTITVTAEDGTTTGTYTITKTAYTPLAVNSDIEKTTFDAVPSWIYNPYGFDADKGVKFAKAVNDADNMRISKGNTRQYYFISAAKTLTLTSGTAQNRNINVYRNGVKLASPTETAAKGSSIDIALDETASCMIMIESNQTSGDGGFTKYAVTAATATVAVTGVTLDKTTADVEVGKTVTLTATVAPENATNKNVTWASDDETIATVEDGVVTGVAEGTANITVTTVDGSFTDICTVTVKAATPVETPLVTLPTETRDGYGCTGSTATASYSGNVYDGETVYLIDGGKSITLTVPAYTVVSKIRVSGTSNDNNTTTVTITGVNNESASSEFANRKSATATVLDFAPTTQTTTYTISSSNKGSWVIIKVYGEEKDEATVSVSSVGYATFSSNKAFDFSGTDITVYKAMATGTSVKLTEVEDGIVPANTGVVLYAAGGASATVPVATSTGATTWDDNEMVANVVRAKVYLTEGDKTNYILSNEEETGVGFYLAASGGAYLPANRAYLSTTTATTTTNPAPFLGFGEGEGTTSINSLTPALSQGEGVYYDLSGRRVAQPTKGLYIVNGKKVLVP